MADKQFMTLGTHCSEQYCNQLDFLPFKCASCKLPFCSDHWRPPAGHICASYDPAKEDNRIPSCPLCSAPVSHAPSTSPDAAMDLHLSTSCAVLNPDAARAPSPGAMPVCQHARCKTKLVVPFGCDKCGAKFCASHRWASDHACQGKLVNATAGAKAGTKPVGGGKGLAGLAALRRAQANLAAKNGSASASTGSASTVPTQNGSGPTPTGSGPKAGSKLAGSQKLASATGGVLGSKSDRRAVAEAASKRKAMEVRARKGLLSEREKVEYATLVALEAEGKNPKKGDGCCLS